MAARVPGAGEGSPQGPLASEEKESCLAAGSSPGHAAAMSLLVRGKDFASRVCVGVETVSLAPPPCLSPCSPAATALVCVRMGAGNGRLQITLSRLREAHGLEVSTATFLLCDLRRVTALL